MDVAHENNIELEGTEGRNVADDRLYQSRARLTNNLHSVLLSDLDVVGACGGELACSTCHLIFDQETFDSLPPMTEEEQDMLDLAFEVTETSRLGCQIKVTDAFEGIKVRYTSRMKTLLRKVFSVLSLSPRVALY